MTTEVVSLDYFLMVQNSPKTGSGRCRRDAEDLFMQPAVIFPRVHVARNVGIRDGQPVHSVAMGFEKGAQASFWVEV